MVCGDIAEYLFECYQAVTVVEPTFKVLSPEHEGEMMAVLLAQAAIEWLQLQPHPIYCPVQRGRCSRIACGGIVKCQVQSRGAQRAFLIRLDTPEGFECGFACRGGITSEQMNEREVPECKRDI